MVDLHNSDDGFAAAWSDELSRRGLLRAAALGAGGHRPPVNVVADAGARVSGPRTRRWKATGELPPGTFASQAKPGAVRRARPPRTSPRSFAVARSARRARTILLLDEPTAALGVVRTRQDLDLIRRIRDTGVAVVLVGHSRPGVLRAADRITVLRLGRGGR